MSGPILAAILGAKNESLARHEKVSICGGSKTLERGNAQEVPEPVGRRAEGDALGPDTEREGLAEVDPGRGTPLGIARVGGDSQSGI
jgi:hypothetical protein